MKRIILLYISIINLIFSNNWMTHEGSLMSSSSLVIMFQEEYSPKLGNEGPLLITNFANMENIILKYGLAQLNPVFSSYKEFNQQHYKFHLHQYYKLELNQAVDILELVNDLKQLEQIEEIFSNKCKKRYSEIIRSYNSC